MILDYTYNKTKKALSISYIKENGAKGVLSFNVNKFKTYRYSENGQFKNWDGKPCSISYTDRPTTFDMKTYFREMPSKYQALLRGKTTPKLYTFDIETEISDEFPEPGTAKFPITAISVASSELNVVVLGVRGMEPDADSILTKYVREYLNKSEFYRSLGLQPPTVKYIKFDSEHDMLKYFLKNIVAKVPVFAGWNSLLFDWQYIQNRIRGYYPDIYLSSASINWNTYNKKFENMRGDKIYLTLPSHTLILDMMDVISTFDMVVMPMKESLSLDYISSEMVGLHKIEYDGSLQDLYERDYTKYVFYNAIDSLLVQLIDKRFKTLQNIYSQALYCEERIESCFSKIALSEALVFNYYYNTGIKIVDDGNYEIGERGTLQGAYVREPTPGKHKYMCCNDFASLYPSTIITCNLSFENFLGNDYTEEELEKFRKDPNYFVSVNGNVYKNDKDYTFKAIQAGLMADRKVGKYLAKQLEANVMSDIEHIEKGINIKNKEYDSRWIKAIAEFGYDVKCTNDLRKLDDLEKFKEQLHNEITYYVSYEQACKLLMNSMYGGSSHQAFFWFNINLAGDITGEARNIIHRMEKHIPEYLRDNWLKLKDVHKNLGIEVDEKVCKDILSKNDSYLEVIYGDTDSLYISYENLLKTIKGIDNISLEDKTKIIVGFNTGHLDEHNRKYMKEYYATRHVDSVQNFELETVALSGVWLDVKKRYAQILLWKDGKTFDRDDLPMKIKGLEIVKSSYPKAARAGLKRLVRYLLEDDGEEGYLLQRLNIQAQKEKRLFFEADLEDICENKGVQNYTKYILDDTNKMGLRVADKCPYNVRAMGNYNRFRNVYNLPGDPLYGGKMKIYIYLSGGKKSKREWETDHFAFQSRNYPKWADEYAPIHKPSMYQKFLLDPFNRILEAIKIGKLNSDGSIEMPFMNSLF